MSDALRVEDGMQPWLPATGVRAGEVLDFYNVPRSGLLHLNGLTYFFSCILGDGGPTGVWAYAHVADQEMSALLNTHGPDDFDAVADGLLRHRWVTVAAVGDYHIIESAILDAGLEGPEGLVDRLMKHWDRVMRTREDVRELVDTTAH